MNIMIEVNKHEIEACRSKIREMLTELNFDFYIVSSSENFFKILDYPYRLIGAQDLLYKSGKIHQTNIEKIHRPDKLILDSGIFNPNIINADVLRIAEIVQPTYIVPKDFLGDSKKSVESTLEMLSMIDSYKVNNTEVLIPLQPPWQIDERLLSYSYFGIGGIARMGDRNTAESAIKKTAFKYSDKMFHIFGKRPSSFMHLILEAGNIISSDIAIALSFAIKSSRTGNVENKNIGIVSVFNEIVATIMEIINIYDHFRFGRKQVSMF